MQAAVSREQVSAETPATFQILFDRFWEDVAPFNNYSPEAARALLERETELAVQVVNDSFLSDPWVAVRAALTERAAGRKITRFA